MTLSLTLTMRDFDNTKVFEVIGIPGTITNKVAKSLTAADENGFTAKQGRKAEVATTGDSQFLITGTPLT